MHVCMDDLALDSETLIFCISFFFSATLEITNGKTQVWFILNTMLVRNEKELEYWNQDLAIWE